MIGAIFMKFGLTPTTWTNRMTAQSYQPEDFWAKTQVTIGHAGSFRVAIQ